MSTAALNTDSRQPWIASPSWRRDGGILLLAWVASLGVTGYQVYGLNHPLQLPLVHWLVDPGLYEGDPFAATLPLYASALWRGVAKLANWISLEPLLLTLFLLERLFVLLAADAVARKFAPRSHLARVGAIVWFALAPAPYLGGGTLVLNTFEQTGCAVPCLVLAIVAVAANRPWAWVVWFSLGLHCNSMTAGYAAVYCGASWIAAPTCRRDWRRWTVAAILGLLLTAPTLAMSWSAMRTSADNRELWLTVARLRFPHHLVPTTWPIVAFSKLALATCGVLAGAWWALRSVPLVKSTRAVETLDVVPALPRFLIIWTIVAGSWIAAAFVADKLGLPALLVMHPARGADLWYPLAACGLIASLATRIAHDAAPRRSASLAFIAAVTCWQGERALVMAGGTLLWIVWNWARGRREFPRMCLAPIVLTALILCGAASVGRLMSADGSGWYDRGDAAIDELATWAESETNRDALFLVDPSEDEFRAKLRRPIFVTYKDASAILWDRSYVGVWAERMAALGGDAETLRRQSGATAFGLRERYAAMTDADVASLTPRIDYWVVAPTRETRWPVVFRNARYVVVARAPAPDAVPAQR